MPLFKYMSVAVAILFTASLKIRFTQPFELNDPFELSPMLDFEGSAEAMRDVIDAKIDEAFGSVDGLLAIAEKYMATDPNFPKLPIQVLRKLLEDNPAIGQKLVQEMRQHQSELLESFKLSALLEAGWEKFRAAAGQAVGILSLTEDPANTLMWSHYGGQHGGVAVEFDQHHPWFDQRKTSSDDLRRLVQVCYVQNPQPRTWTQVSGVDILYTKNAVWAYEREWRIIQALKEGAEISPGIFCFDVPPDALRSIIFGCRTGPELERQIRDSVAANPNLKHVTYKRAKLVGGRIEIVDATLDLAINRDMQNA